MAIYAVLLTILGKTKPQNGLQGHQKCRQYDIPSDFVVKFQAIDIAEVILALIRQPNVVLTLWRNRQSRRERLSTSEAHGSTTKSDGMWENLVSTRK